MKYIAMITILCTYGLIFAGTAMAIGLHQNSCPPGGFGGPYFTGTIRSSGDSAGARPAFLPYHTPVYSILLPTVEDVAGFLNREDSVLRLSPPRDTAGNANAPSSSGDIRSASQYPESQFEEESRVCDDTRGSFAVTSYERPNEDDCTINLVEVVRYLLNMSTDGSAATHIQFHPYITVSDTPISINQGSLRLSFIF